MMTLLLIGLVIGVVLGLTGAGGSVLAVPLLIIFLNLLPTVATGLALGVVFASSLYGAVLQTKSKQVLWIPVVVFGLTCLVVAPIGRALAHRVNDQWIVWGFVILSLLIALRLLWQSIKHPEEVRVVRAQLSDGDAEPLLSK